MQTCSATARRDRHPLPAQGRRYGWHSLPGVSDWLHGPHTGYHRQLNRVLTHNNNAVKNASPHSTPGCQIYYMDHTGCHQLNRVLTHNNNVVKSATNPTRRQPARGDELHRGVVRRRRGRHGRRRDSRPGVRGGALQVESS
jgi:hypothetical protein